MKLLPLMVAGAWAWPVGAAPPEPPAWRVRAQMEIVRVPLARGVALIPRLTDAQTAAAAVAEIAAACGRGDAERVAILSGQSLSGEPMKASQAGEYRYPIEFSHVGSEIPMSAPAKDAPPRNDLRPFPATDFDTKSLGAQWEATPTVSADGSVLRMRMKAAWSQLDGSDRFVGATLADGSQRYFDHPIFLLRESSTTLLMRPGIPELVGSFKVPGPHAAMELHILTTSVHRFGGQDRGGKIAPAQTASPAESTALLAPDEAAGWQVRMELQRFRLPQVEAMELRPRLLDSAETGGAAENLLAMVAARGAELREWLILPVQSGRTAVGRNLRERSFAVQYDAPIVLSFSFRTVFRLAYGGGEPFLVPDFGICPEMPTSFETRQTGAQWVVEPVVSSDGRQIELSWSGWQVDGDGFTRWSFDFPGKAVHYYQPKFASRLGAAKTRLANGQRSLLQFQKLPGPSGEVEITLLRAVATHPFHPASAPSK